MVIPPETLIFYNHIDREDRSNEERDAFTNYKNIVRNIGRSECQPKLSQIEQIEEMRKNSH